MNTSLTTFDGYPRADIDVAQIRTTRARIIRLKNDHKAVMAKLEIAVQEQFAAAKAAESETAAQQGPVQSTEGASSSSTIEPPFAKVNTVTPRSPAERAGLKPGDKVIRFGIANWTNHERLTKVAEVVQQNENVSSNHTLLINSCNLLTRRTSVQSPSKSCERSHQLRDLKQLS
jgi:26S proteasome non-ATPase regulatory subunit 9